MPKETKLCQRCKRVRPLKDFTLPRHRICIPCATAQKNAALWFSNTARAQVATPRGVTSTTVGKAYYQREYYRRNVMKRNPVEPPLILPNAKLCRRCQQWKPLNEFETWRMRVCLVCDGPPIGQR